MVRRIGDVNYEVDMVGRRKRLRVFHVNMLKKWHESTTAHTTFLAEELSCEAEDGVILWEKTSRDTAANVNTELTRVQKQALDSLLSEYSKTLQNMPGRTSLAEHDIDVGTAKPVRCPPYWLPYAYRDLVKAELQEMEKDGIIEPSSSKWSSPLVLVKKKDGSMRFCVDYQCLNSVARYNAYPMPHVNELIDRLGNAQYISTLDLARGYW